MFATCIPKIAIIIYGHVRSCITEYCTSKGRKEERMALAVKCIAFFFTVLWSLLIAVRITFEILKNPVAAFKRKIRNSKQSAHGKLELIMHFS